MAFQKGRPRPPGAGRKPGVPNKATAEFRRLCQSLVMDKIGWRKLRKKFRDGDLDPSTLRLFTEHAVGKAPDALHVIGEDHRPIRIVHEFADDPNKDGKP